MVFLRMFGIGVTDAIAGKETSGIVTEVKTCWWLKVNTKAIRNGALDGAQFPHIIHFTYHVNGQTYTGKRYVNWNKRCPAKDEHITVHYEEASPEKYAVII
jgi:hypothetical protein